jgi:hypothetical protein
VLLEKKKSIQGPAASALRAFKDPLVAELETGLAA